MPYLDEIEELVKSVVGAIGLSFDNPDDDWIATAVLFKDRQVDVMVLADLSDEDAKDMAVDAVCWRIFQSKADACAFVLSSWVVKGIAPNDEGEPVIDLLVPPSKHPNRIEMLSLAILSTSEQRFLSAEIKRTDDAPPTLSEWEALDEEVRLTGRFYDGPMAALQAASDRG